MDRASLTCRPALWHGRLASFPRGDRLGTSHEKHFFDTGFSGAVKQSLGPILALPGQANDYHDAYIRRVADSFARVTGSSLAEAAGLDGGVPGRSAWFGDFALLTHRGDGQATLNYGNAFVLGLWECRWEEFAGLPSAATAPPQDHASRDAMMQAVARDKFVRGYSGRRVSRKGRLFRIENVTIWRLLDQTGGAFGVGAFFKSWR